MADDSPVAKLLRTFTVFRTVKMVKIHDPKLLLLHQLSLGLAFIYMLYSIILDHGYMKTESPSLTVSTLVNGYNHTEQQDALVLATELLTAPDYCNMSSAVHWDYGPYEVWQYPQCVGYLTHAEFIDAKADEIWVHTNIVQRLMGRSCAVASTVSNATLVDPVENVSLINLGGNCSIVTATYLNEYVWNPEAVTVTLQPTYSTSWMPVGLFSSVTLMGQNGKPLGPEYVFGDEMTVLLSDLLLAAGMTLDDQNTNSGGKGLFTELQAAGSNTNSDTDWPSFRTTGVTLRAKLRVANFRASSPLNFNVTAQMFVENASPGAWTSAPTEVQYKGAGSTTFDAQWIQRNAQGVHIVFTSEGLVGQPTALKAVSALLNAFVMGLIAIAFTDFAAAWVSSEFAAEKYEDDGERAALDTLLEKEADHGVPFNFEDLRLRQANGELSEECYESAIFRLEKEMEELRQGGLRVRGATAIIAEDIGLPGLLDDTGPPPEPVYKLMGVGTSDVILLFPGDNVIGRGLGDIKTPTVSRKQVCITIDPDSKRAFVRSMRAEKAPSIPAIMRSSSQQTTWRALTQKGQSLSLGDTLCMQLKPAPLGKPPGRLNEYIVVSLDTAPPPEPSFFDKLRFKMPFM